MNRLWLCLAAVGASLAQAPALAQDSSLIVDTEYGRVEGFVDEITDTWLGIPFAAPPVGALRWKATEEPTPWTGVRPAVEFAQPCVQTDGNGGVQGGEDCLYLNVWRPQAPSATPRPVMVWIHGGGNELGATSDFVYNGAKLAVAADVVLVSITYRLGALGWLHHEALKTGEPLSDSGNFGLLDIMQALRWVRSNSAGFGGDADNVTIFGESAGGMNIWALLLSPLSEGLYDRVIIQSGYPQRITLPLAEQVSGDLLASMVVADGLATAETVDAFLAAQTTAWIRSYFYSSSPQDLLTATAEVTDPMTRFYAIEDGVVQPADLYGALAAGDIHHVPMIGGSNLDEMKTFIFPAAAMTRRGYNQALDDLFGDQAETVKQLYPRRSYEPATWYNSFADILGFTLEQFGAVYGSSIATLDAPVWVYQFRFDELAPPFDYAIGAGHGLELPLLFDNVQEVFYAEGTEDERAIVTQTLQGYWGCFAHFGDVSDCGDSLRPWETFTDRGAAPYSRMIIDDRLFAEPVAAVEFDQINFWLDFMGWEELPPM